MAQSPLTSSLWTLSSPRKQQLPSTMGKGRFTVNPFPELTMTAADRLHLQDLANDLIASNLEQYNKFTTVDKRQVNPQRWKFIKSREQLKAYSEVSSANQNSSLPMILCYGSLEGKMDDMMYGLVAEDLEAMRVKASYVEEHSGAAVLGSIVEPTMENPFQTLMIKWFERDLPLSSLNLVKNRDYVFLEGTGFLNDSNGDRVGYHLLHSVDFPQTQELPNRIRGNVSISAFWRQMQPNTIEMYCTGIFDPRGALVRKLVVPGMANAILCSVKYTYCGMMRKLLFALDKAYSESKVRGTPDRRNICVSCSTPITNRRIGDFSKSNSACRLCFGHVCGACKAERKLSFVDPDLVLSQRKVTFCSACISSVSKMDAAECARVKMMNATANIYPHTSSATRYLESGSEASFYTGSS